jgi:peptidoglycan-associated lipoprotein
MTNEEERPMNLTHSFASVRGTMFAVFTAAVLAGCSSVKLDDVPVETRTPTAGTGAGAGSSGTSQSRVEPVDLTKGAGNTNGAGRVIYFDFDSYVVKDEYRGIIDSYAKALAADRKKHLSVEGHTDERGGREYNLALGQKRAEAVAKSLALLGAGDSQVEAVSFGKERPAVQGSDEAAWAKNRRAELNYR